MILSNRLLNRLSEREGGFVNNPYDRGGPTKYGITLNTLSNWRGYTVTVEEIKKLDKKEANEIYNQEYWIKPGFNTLEGDERVIELLFDSAVHHGPSNAIKMLQEALQLKTDGIIGPRTRQAVKLHSNNEVLAKMIGARLRFIARIVRRDPSQTEFILGWSNRLIGFLNMIN